MVFCVFEQAGSHPFYPLRGTEHSCLAQNVERMDLFSKQELERVAEARREFLAEVDSSSSSSKLFSTRKDDPRWMGGAPPHGQADHKTNFFSGCSFRAGSFSDGIFSNKKSSADLPLEEYLLEEAAPSNLEERHQEDKLRALREELTGTVHTHPGTLLALKDRVADAEDSDDYPGTTTKREAVLVDALEEIEDDVEVMIIDEANPFGVDEPPALDFDGERIRFDEWQRRVGDFNREFQEVSGGGGGSEKEDLLPDSFSGRGQEHRGGTSMSEGDRASALAAEGVLSSSDWEQDGGAGGAGGALCRIMTGEPVAAGSSSSHVDEEDELGAGSLLVLDSPESESRSEEEVEEVESAFETWLRDFVDAGTISSDDVRSQLRRFERRCEEDSSEDQSLLNSSSSSGGRGEDLGLSRRAEIDSDEACLSSRGVEEESSISEARSADGHVDSDGEANKGGEELDSEAEVDSDGEVNEEEGMWSPR